MNTLRNEVMGDGKDVGDWSNFPGTGDHFQFFWEKCATEDLYSCTLA